MLYDMVDLTTLPSSSTTTAGFDTTATARQDTSLAGSRAATEALSEARLKDLQSTVIEKSRTCHTLLYTPTYGQTWFQQANVRKSMADFMTALENVEKFDTRYDFGIGDKSIYLPHEGDSRPKPDKINRQLVEWGGSRKPKVDICPHSKRR